MRILFTGASSFTGYWFVRTLAEHGHAVTACFRQSPDAYADIRQKRVAALQSICQPIFNIHFGSDSFLNVIQTAGPWDLFCHHAADVSNYKSADFDVMTAVNNNTKNLKASLAALKEQHCQAILLTGSVFEQDEGGGEHPRACSPYGLSKGLTYQMFRYYTEILALKLGKFVIPNPFGPYEESRFTTYLAQAWLENRIPRVLTPAYIRDNIHVDLLAQAYTRFAEQLVQLASPALALHPSGYAESQGDFTERFAREMKRRWSMPCLYELKQQKDFPEPLQRINKDILSPDIYHWCEKTAWDRLADYYLTHLNIQMAYC